MKNAVSNCHTWRWSATAASSRRHGSARSWRQPGLNSISCLRAPQIAALANDAGPLQLSLFDERDTQDRLADFPGERLVACRNPALAEERARKREELLQQRNVG